VSAFADAEVIRAATTQFVPVAADDWYQRRRQDAEGEFFRAVADRLGRRGVGGATRQGVYVFTAAGTPLAFKNSGGSAADTRALLADGLQKFAALPAAERTPGGVAPPAPEAPDADLARTPPPGGLVVKTFTRILDHLDGRYCKGACGAVGGDKAARDHLWITADEVRALAPAKTAVGFRYAMPEKVATRLARFHLVDNTRGEPAAWERGQVRAKRFTLRVVAATAEAVDLQLDGEAVMTTDRDPATAARGFAARLAGDLRYRPATGTFDRFDLVAVGEAWGDQADMQAARPGRSLLGVVFELARDGPGDRIPPQAARDPGAYFGRDRWPSRLRF